MARIIIDRWPAYRLTDAGLEFSADIHFEDWETLGDVIGRMNRGVRWAVGDWLLHAEMRAEWGDKYTQAIESTGLDYQTVANCRWVSSRIELSRRRETLSWSHHELVARLDPAKQEEWLDKAEANGWTRAEFRRMIAGEQPVPGERGRGGPGGGDSAPRPAPAMTPLEAAKAAYLRLTEGQRSTFREWLDELEQPDAGRARHP